MSIIFWESLILISAGICLLTAIIFLLTAKKNNLLRKSVFGAIFGLIAAIGFTFFGLVAVLIASLIIRYPLEIALSVIMSVAVTALPIGAYIGGKSK